MTFSDLETRYGTITAICEAYGLNYRTVWGWRKAGKIPARAAADIGIADALNASTPMPGSPAPSTEDAAGVAATE